MVFLLTEGQAATIAFGLYQTLVRSSRSEIKLWPSRGEKLAFLSTVQEPEKYSSPPKHPCTLATTSIPSGRCSITNTIPTTPNWTCRIFRSNTNVQLRRLTYARGGWRILKGSTGCGYPSSGGRTCSKRLGSATRLCCSTLEVRLSSSCSSWGASSESDSGMVSALWVSARVFDLVLSIAVSSHCSTPTPLTAPDLYCMTPVGYFVRFSNEHRRYSEITSYYSLILLKRE